MVIEPPIEVTLKRLEEIAQEIPDSVWLLVLRQIKKVLEDRWFGDDQNEEAKLDELVRAIDNGNHQKAGQLIEQRENSEEIERTIGDMCQEVLECEPKDERAVQRRLSRYEAK